MPSNDRELLLFLFVAMTFFTWICIKLTEYCMRCEQHSEDVPRYRDYRSDALRNAGYGRKGYGHVKYH